MERDSRIVSWLTVLFVQFLARIIAANGMRGSLQSWRQDLCGQLAVELRRRGVSQGLVSEMFEVSAETIRCWTRHHETESNRQTVNAWRLAALVRLSAANGKPIALDTLRHGRYGKWYDTWFHAMIHELEVENIIEYTNEGLSCRVKDAAALERAFPTRNAEVDADLVWACVYRHGPLSATALATLVDLPRPELEEHLAVLERQHRVRGVGDADDRQWSSSHFKPTPGEPPRCEAALHDHFSAIFDSVGGRLDPHTPAPWPQAFGGSTWSFDLWPGHRDEAKAHALLADLREKVAIFSEEHKKYHDANVADAPPEQIYRVVLYLGQGVVQPGAVAEPTEEMDA